MDPQPQPQALPQQENQGGGQNYQQIVEQLMGGSNDPNKLKQIAPELAKYGITLSNANDKGELSKIILPDGTPVRVIGSGEGHPVYLPQPGNWGPGGVPLGGQTSGVGAGGVSNSGGNQYSSLGATPDELRSYGVPGNQYASQAYGGGYTPPQWGQSFQAPTLSESNDPGLQARFNFGHQANERAAAAKGTILNGGTQQALNMFGQDYASNEYANVFDRAFKQYQQKYGEFQDAANLGLRAEQNQYGEYLGEQNRTLSDYLTNYNIGRTGVQDFLGQQNKTADRGLNATLGGRP